MNKRSPRQNARKETCYEESTLVNGVGILLCVTTSWRVNEGVAGLNAAAGDDVEPEADEYSDEDEDLDIDGSCSAIFLLLSPTFQITSFNSWTTSTPGPIPPPALLF